MYSKNRCISCPGFLFFSGSHHGCCYLCVLCPSHFPFCLELISVLPAFLLKIGLERREFLSAVYRWHLMNIILAKFCTVQTHFPCHHLDECEWQNCRVWISSHRGSWACPLWPCIRTKPSPEESRPPASQPDWLLMGQDMLSNPERSIWHDSPRSQF